MTRPTREETDLFSIFLVLLLIPALPIAYGWALSRLWNAALVPFAFPTLTFAHGLAITALAMAIRMFVVGTVKDEQPASTVAAGGVLKIVGLAILVGMVALVTP